MKKNDFSKKTETAVLGGGCFWCLEALYSQLKGVTQVVSGYAGGTTTNPSYEEVSRGATNHAEMIKISFDPDIITYADILNIFFLYHDPTTPNRQGHDIGPQYRSLILYSGEEQKQTAEKVKREIEERKLYPSPVVTEIRPLEVFYPAEEYHQKYAEKNPAAAYCRLVIAPKLQKLKKEYAKFMRT